ncbi:hypothetical protein BDK92_0644 [Micromonospora pisi]|uniref:Uncharacterized protein n=1 Tax=Micromonospora pisi TaxID=589240 RepID=A0A495JEC2_9ACTN|nr:hypothetical protein [Micromonospora pisi]RKR86419.1 hypothetical protein BDK92_0644 [Micromonospora pisi]
MTDLALPQRARLADRWPTALAFVAIAGAISVIVLVGREAEFFGPSVATMAGIYLAAYATGRPWTAWLAFAVLSAVVSGLHLLRRWEVLDVDPAVGMTALLVPLWLWTVLRRRFTDVGTFSVQTAGMFAFGAITLACAAVQPRLGALLAGLGFLTHGAWDAYHFRADKVVNRPWSEFCGVVDVAVGTALVIVAAT